PPRRRPRSARRSLHRRASKLRIASTDRPAPFGRGSPVPSIPIEMSTPITAQMVNELRAQTGAGLMDCKRALVDSNGNVEEAITILRKKGAASAAKKADRAAKEGLIESYIHLGGKVGVMIEVNCETDFVARNDEFRLFVKDLCLHIAAASPLYVSRDQVPEADLNSEREIAAAQVVGKPPAAIQKIVEGKLEKFYSSVVLLDQPFVKIPEKTVKELITEKIAKTGENIQIRRFVRFQLGS
ncbi:MAG TPA: translation elongation factor Ts, partial [Opitutaceae bacterium]|nr:translation elongation factor Ts [Opitutaceae bacterium]